MYIGVVITSCVMITSWTLHYSTNNSTYTLYLWFPWDLDSAEPQRRERCESCSLPDKTARLTHSSLWAREHHWTETFPGHSHAHTSWEKMKINTSQVRRVCLSKSGPLIERLFLYYRLQYTEFDLKLCCYYSITKKKKRFASSRQRGFCFCHLIRGQRLPERESNVSIKAAQ